MDVCSYYTFRDNCIYVNTTLEIAFQGLFRSAIRLSVAIILSEIITYM